MRYVFLKFVATVVPWQPHTFIYSCYIAAIKVISTCAKAAAGAYESTEKLLSFKL